MHHDERETNASVSQLKPSLILEQSASDLKTRALIDRFKINSNDE